MLDGEMIKKDSILALVLLLLMALVLVCGGILSGFINPEMAAGHPNYARNFHLLTELKIGLIFASVAGMVGLWIVACFLVLRSKKRPSYWLLLAALGPVGFAILTTLNDREPAKADSYSQFLRKMNWAVRTAYEIVTFFLVWSLAYEAMVLHRTLMIRFQSATTGIPIEQIVDLQNASSGMWAFSEGLEVIFIVVLLYLLRPFLFSLVARAAAARTSSKS